MNEKEQLEKMVQQWLQFVDQLMKTEGLPIVPDQKTGQPLWVDVRELRFKYLIPVSRIKPFFDGLKEGKVMATRCKECGAQYFPPQADCPACVKSEMEWFPVKGEGRLLTYTVISVKPLSYMHYPDYVVGVAKMGEGFNVLAWVACEDPKKLRRGMPVKLEVRRREPEGFFSYYLLPSES